MAGVKAMQRSYDARVKDIKILQGQVAKLESERDALIAGLEVAGELTLKATGKLAEVEAERDAMRAENERLREWLVNLQTRAINILKSKPKNNADHGMRGCAESFRVDIDNMIDALKPKEGSG